MANPAVAKNSAGAATLWDADQVARDLGVAAVIVRELEPQLDPTCDLRTVRRVTVFTESGRAKLRAMVELRMAAEKNPPGQAAAAPTAERPREDLKVTRVFNWSPRLLCVRENGLEVVLQVKSQKHLQPGMVLKECICGEGCWFYYGSLPRSIGERQLFFPKPKETEKP